MKTEPILLHTDYIFITFYSYFYSTAKYANNQPSMIQIFVGFLNSQLGRHKHIHAYTLTQQTVERKSKYPLSHTKSAVFIFRRCGIQPTECLYLYTPNRTHTPTTTHVVFPVTEPIDNFYFFLHARIKQQNTYTHTPSQTNSHRRTQPIIQYTGDRQCDWDR